MESDVRPTTDDQAPAEPDIMNDPAFNPPPKSITKSSDDVDTCRICRGEGTAEEPLFYPCKCSGSIKFVHQDCLMEWLSHSQKKHCELCKTPFRFTKLYHPQMPQNLPTTVFLRKAIAHVVKGFFTWCRGMLVASVWLFWLPWSMRFVWWGLFWIGDGGWVYNTNISQHWPSASYDSSWDDGSVQKSNSSLLPLTLQQHGNSTPFDSAIHRPLMKIFQISKLLFVLITSGNSSRSISNDSTSSANTTLHSNNTRNADSLLSGISFFQNLTPSPVINKVVTDILEGQIITLSVVVAFVLVFLIREWVVQQQPAINLGAGDHLEINNRRNDPPGAREAENLHVEEEHAPTDEALPPDPSVVDLGNSESMKETPARGGVSSFGVIDQLVGEECARLVALSSMDGDIDPNYAAKRHILLVANAMEASAVDVIELLQPNISTSPRYGELIAKLQSDMVAHSIEVRKILLALQDVSSQALQSEDSELLSLSLENAELLKDAVNRYFPYSLRSQVLEPTEKTEQWIRVGFQMLSSRQDLEKSQRELEVLEAEYTNKLNRLKNLENISGPSNTARDEIRIANLQTRPTMPTRSLSSVAAEVRRELEEKSDTLESSSGHVNAVKDGVVDSESAGSSESWQRVPMVDGAVHMSYNKDPRDLDKRSPSANDGISHTLPQPELVGDVDALTSNAQQQAEDLDIGNPPQAIHAAEDPAVEVAGRSTTQMSETTEYDTSSQRGALGTLDAAPQARAPLLDRLWDWMWGDIPPTEPEQEREIDDEHIVEDVADEAPFVPFVEAQPQERFDDQANDHDVHEPDIGVDPLEGGLNPNDFEAVEDAEDLEGIMELIGMQGPLAGLFQNSVFCAVLISATVTSAVWFPYLWGKIVLVFLANPMQLVVKVPWLLVSSLSNFAIDFCLFLGGTILCWLDTLIRFSLMPVEWFLPSLVGLSSWNGFGKAMSSVSDSALIRIAKMFMTSNEATAPDFYHLTLSSHAALYAIRSSVTSFFVQIFALVRGICSYAASGANGTISLRDLVVAGHWLQDATLRAPHDLATFVASLPELLRTDQIMPVFGVKSLPPLLGDGKMPPWTTTDRLIAVIAGYGFFASAGALYLRLGSPITNSQRGKKIEAIVAEILQQAGGVLKVILIISIEMLLFPLYCGFLLDAATLPLFENASLVSRFNFALHSPWTSGFVHWFLGTCYMFHFALFVSMCRKIVRNGVLYFIRDPDDPTFHPVRDVLERNISSQLRKIGFSALVYGALVILCMGSVVWAVAYGFAGIFPIRWSSDTQLLEFPIDLLIYNTLTPIVIHLLRPSKGLHMIYEWWFRKCARALRLSHFLFGEEREDEEGRRSGSDGGNVKTDGRFVRAPASDQVRVPKGRSVFVEVDADNNRLDGQPDDVGSEHGAASESYTKVFVPPWFRARIAFFVFCLWALTAVAGLSFTVAPLLFGRWVLRFAVQPGAKINDIYTLSTGIVTFGAAFYAGSSYNICLEYLRKTFHTDRRTLASFTTGIRIFIAHALRLVYVYGALTLLIPSLLALLLEFYLIMPLHAYILLRQSQTPDTLTNPPANQVINATAGPRDHTIHFLQDWTLGLLYLRILIRVILWRPNTRPARALRAIGERGWLDPNAALATRCFILPCTILGVLALVMPAPLGWLSSRFLLADSAVGDRAVIYKVNAFRFAYPAVLATALTVWGVLLVWKVVGMWRRRVRDEVYLIGERLHNFGETRPPGKAAATVAHM